MLRPLPFLLLSFATAAAAQPGLQDRHQIAVRQSEDGRQCEYQIQGQEDQDLFLVRPNGKVQFQPRGAIIVKVTVEPDPSGIAGGEGVREMWVSNSRPNEFPVRTDLDRVTEHEVVIECCTRPRRNGTCPADRLVRATPAVDLLGELSGLARGAPSGPDATDGSPRGGLPKLIGPRMQVGD